MLLTSRFSALTGALCSVPRAIIGGLSPEKQIASPDGQGLALSCLPRSGDDDSPELVDSLPDESAQTAAMVAPPSPSSADGDLAAAGALGPESGEEKPANLPDAADPPALSPAKAVAESDPRVLAGKTC